MITLQRYKHFLKKVYTLIRKCIGLTNFSFLKKVYTHFFHNFAEKTYYGHEQTKKWSRWKKRR